MFSTVLRETHPGHSHIKVKVQGQLNNLSYMTVAFNTC